MISRTFVSSWQVMLRPMVLVPSACATVAAHLLYATMGAERGFLSLPPGAMWLASAAIAARFWIGLSVSATALDLLRARGRWRPFRFVTASVALQAGIVCVALALPALAATVFLIVPGVILAIRWSQAAMLIVDGHSAWFASAEDSARLVHGRRLEILSIWLIIGAALAIVAWLQHAAMGLASALHAPPFALQSMTLLVKIPVDAFSLVLVGATYDELDREASVVDEPSPPRSARLADLAEEPVTWQ
jgi:hypothetical protein